MILSCHQPQYIPWLGYFDKIAKSDVFVFLDCVQYKPREFENRNKIRTQNGWMWLTIPVITKRKGRQRICEVKIDDGFPWRRQHWQSLKTWYGRAPYFKTYAPYFEGLYQKPTEVFCEFVVEIIKFFLVELKIETQVFFESQIKTSSPATGRILELCQKLKADTYLSGIGGKNYLDEEMFQQTGIRLLYQDFIHPIYRQQFMRNQHDFIPCMSILDLLFNEGPNSRKILGL